MVRHILTTGQEGPCLRPLVATTINRMVFWSRGLKRWVLGPSIHRALDAPHSVVLCAAGLLRRHPCGEHGNAKHQAWPACVPRRRTSALANIYECLSIVACGVFKPDKHLGSSQTISYGPQVQNYMSRPTAYGNPVTSLAIQNPLSVQVTSYVGRQQEDL